MGKIVILDTNVLFRGLRARSESLREVLISSNHRFVSAKYLIVELFKHKARILANTQCPESEVW